MYVWGRIGDDVPTYSDTLLNDRSMFQMFLVKVTGVQLNLNVCTEIYYNEQFTFVRCINFMAFNGRFASRTCSPCLCRVLWNNTELSMQTIYKSND